jgi:hypothetical protein
MYKYKLKATAGYPIDFSINRKAIPDLYKHIAFPDVVTEDLVVFAGKMCESGPNLNRAFFANDELIKAYPSLLYKAVDIEHEIDKVVGHIYSGVYVNRSDNSMIDVAQYAQSSQAELANQSIDVVIGGLVYIDRFPALQSPIERKAYALSMECYLESFSILLENGTMLSLDEAEAFGLGEFIEQLMGEFKSEEEFNRAHTLNVIFADATQKQMKIYKYLHNITWGGVGLVIQPACPSCTIQSTSCDCEDLKMAASSQTLIPTLDLRKVDSYMKSIREHGGTVMVHQVTEEIKPEETAQVVEDQTTEVKIEEAVVISVTDNTAVEVAEQIDTIRDAPPTMSPPPSTLPKTPNDITSHPAQCLQYRYQEEISCLFANAICEAAGDRKDKSCRRWFQDDKGVWKFDSRNSITDEEEIVVNENLEDPGTLDDETAKRKHLEWLTRKIESLEYALESFHLDRELAQSKLSEKSATWTTQLVNGLPNSSFAVIETGYKEGDNKNARHLPFKDGGGKVDLPHLRNALARANQIKNVLGKDSDADLRARAQRKLAPYAKRYLKTKED